MQQETSSPFNKPFLHRNRYSASPPSLESTSTNHSELQMILFSSKWLIDHNFISESDKAYNHTFNLLFTYLNNQFCYSLFLFLNPKISIPETKVWPSYVRWSIESWKLLSFQLLITSIILIRQIKAINRNWSRRV